MGPPNFGSSLDSEKYQPCHHCEFFQFDPYIKGPIERPSDHRCTKYEYPVFTLTNCSDFSYQEIKEETDGT